MNVSNLIELISLSNFSFWDAATSSHRDEDSNHILQMITGIGIGALTLGALYCKRRRDQALTSLNWCRRGLTSPPSLTHYPQLKELDLSFNELMIAPNLSKNPELRKLDLAANELTDSPDFSLNPELQALKLNLNQLSRAPDLSKNKQLQHLNLSNNRLREPPNVLENTQLKSLFLNQCELRSPPDVSKNRRLVSLSLSHNELESPPTLSANPALTILYLARNRLTIPPNVSNNPYLTELDLHYNELTSVPDLSKNAWLRNLDLSHNRLTTLPDVSHNPRLENLNLSNNRLTEIPDSYLSLPRRLRINLQRNLFSAEYLTAFRSRLQAHRAAHPGQGPDFQFSVHDVYAQNLLLVPLKDQLNTWVAEIQAAFPEERIRLDFSSLFSEAADVKDSLSYYLQRLREIKDYKAKGKDQKNVIRRVYEMIKLASENKEFKAKMLALIEGGTETCGDRVLIVFNDLEILAQFHQNLSPAEFRALAIRASRYEELKKHAKDICDAYGLGDEIETILYFQLQLKEALKLPISTNEMLYPSMSGVTYQMLVAAKEKMLAVADEELLAKSDYWLSHLEQLHPEKVKEIKDSYHIVLEKLPGYFDVEEKEGFLALNPDIKNFLARAKQKGVALEYSKMAQFCIEERGRAIVKACMF
jgi:Leucine-rich repeat (LRR) protein